MWEVARSGFCGPGLWWADCGVGAEGVNVADEFDEEERVAEEL